MVDTSHYLILSTIVFTIGVTGVLTRRNVIIILMSIELMLNFQDLSGQVFAVFVITVAAAEAAIGLGIVIALFSNKETVNVDEIDLLRG
jgi:NADH-quinone oxidoreductase subunit K